MSRGLSPRRAVRRTAAWSLTTSYLRAVAPRSRILAYGSAAALVVAGGICAVFADGVVGQVLTVGLITLGLGGALLLVFFEVGLSEDQARAKDEERRRLGDGAATGRRLRRRRRPRSRGSG